MPVFTALGLLLIINLGYWKATTETLALVIAASAVCMIIGIPLGILAARRKWIYAGMRPVLDLMQTIPTFVYLIPALVLFGLGMVPGLIATVIFAIPAPVRLTRLGIVSTPPALVEAAVAFGATPSQVLRKVELGHFRPGGRQRSGCAGGARAQYRQYRHGLRSGTVHRHTGDRSRPAFSPSRRGG